MTDKRGYVGGPVGVHWQKRVGGGEKCSEGKGAKRTITNSSN